MPDLTTDAGQPGAADATPISVVTPPAETPARISTTEAARLLASLRKRPTDDRGQRAESGGDDSAARPPSPESEPAQAAGDDAAPPHAEAPGETQEPDPAAQPPIEPPRSWTRDARERWQSLPRETQEYLAEREQERERELRRGQNEAAVERKAIEAERTKAEQVRQQYEAALPQLLLTLHQQAAGEFADVRTVADVERRAREDWPRYLQWDLAQKKVAAVQQEAASAYQRAEHEQRQRFAEFAARQDQLLAEKVPDMADPRKAAELQTAALSVLRDVGFEPGELSRAWNTPGDFSLRDHRVLTLVVDAVRWREAQARARDVARKPVPPVQRPGIAPGKGAQREAAIASLEKELDKSSGVNSLRAAAKLVAMRRGGSSR